MSQYETIQFGTLHFAITTAKWNGEKHHCDIEFEDTHGKQYKTIALGTSRYEVRQAVLDEIKQVYIALNSVDISNADAAKQQKESEDRQSD